MFKSNKGFTLVELIVVIAILAILAGVAIPVYNGYIKRAQDAAVITELDAIKTAAQAANATTGSIEKIVVKDGTIKVLGTEDDGKYYLSKGFNSDFVLFLGETTATTNLGKFGYTEQELKLDGSYKDGATWEDGEWSAGGEIPTDANEIAGGVVTSDTDTDTDTEVETDCDCETPADEDEDGKCDSCDKDLPEDWEGETV